MGSLHGDAMVFDALSDREVMCTHHVLFEENDSIDVCGNVSLVGESVTGLQVGYSPLLCVAHIRDALGADACQPSDISAYV